METKNKIILFSEGTCFGNAEAELQGNSTEVAAETGLVGAIDGDDRGLAGTFPELDLDGVVAQNAHICYIRHRGETMKLPLGMLGLKRALPELAAPSRTTPPSAQGE